MTSSTNPTSPTLRVVVAAGGTAGHLVPALATAETLRAGGHTVVFLTSERPGDERVVERAGFESHAIDVKPLPRRIGVGQVRALWTAFRAALRARSFIRSFAPDVVLAGGGFVSTPAAVAAGWAKVPVVVTEADAHLGLANRISVRRAQRLCTAYPLPGHARVQQVTGRPVGAAFVAAGEPGRREAARRELDIAEDARVLLVVTGSGGATHVNTVVRDCFAGDEAMTVDERPLIVLHVTGRRDFPDVTSVRAQSDRYRVIEYADNMPTLIAAADLVLSRAGGSVFEITAAHRASVLVPFPHATGDHQTRNAEHVVAAGAAELIADADLTVDRLRELVADLLGAGSDDRRARMEAACTTFARPDAARDIAAVVEQLGAAHARSAHERGGRT